MIQWYTNPFLLDFLKVCWQLPQDERDQLEAFTGQPFDIDGAAIGNFTVPGPKWVAKESPEAEPVAVGGLSQQRPGVWRDYMLNTPAAFDKAHWFTMTRHCRRAINAALANGAHRIECVIPAPRLAARPELSRWYAAIGYNREATLHGYCANGADAVIFSKVRHV
jgi:hypothetical protein